MIVDGATGPARAAGRRRRRSPRPSRRCSTIARATSRDGPSARAARAGQRARPARRPRPRSTHSCERRCSRAGRSPMIVALLRHGRTAWNDAQRLQGRADIPLTAAGPRAGARVAAARELARRGALRARARSRRAVETARLVAADASPSIVPDLIEMDWGAWEGDDVRARCARHHAEAFAAAEARGLDFRPPGGESLREVQQRRARAGSRSPAAASARSSRSRTRACSTSLVAHLTGWNGIGRPPVKLRPDCVHLLEVDRPAACAQRAWSRPLLVAPA